MKLKIFIIFSVLVVLAVLIFVIKGNWSKDVKIIETKESGAIVGGIPEGPSEGISKTSQEGEAVNEIPAPSVSGFPKVGEIPLSRTVEELSIGGTAKLRIFDFFINEGKFTPAKIVVNQGDRIQLNLNTNAERGDIECQQLRLSATVEKGQTKFVSFEVPDAGVFQFSCRDYCPGGKRFWGEIIVLEKK